MLAGAAISEMLFWVPQAGSIGTGVSMLSYNGRVQFGVIADRQMIPNPTELIAHVGGNPTIVQRLLIERLIRLRLQLDRISQPLEKLLRKPS